jgi:hypothetical protein
MAAQPNLWGTMDRSTTRPRRERKQDYRQPAPLSAYSITGNSQTLLDEPDWFEDTLAGFRLNPGAVFFPDELVAGNAESRDATPNPLSSVLASVDQLIADPDNDERATEHAYQSARAVLEAAYGRLATKQTNLPAPIVTTDDIGGVRVSWQLGERHVRTSFGATPDQNSYLYFESATEHAVDQLQPTALFTRLEWMIRP